MGKIVDRIALKSDPIYTSSQAILRAAHRAANDAGGGDARFDLLENLLECQLNTLSRSEFTKLISMIVSTDGLSLHQDHGVSGIINGVLEGLSEISFPAEGVCGSLVSMPLQLLHVTPAWFVEISPLIGERIATVLQGLGLIDKESTITFLPRLLSAKEGVALGYHGAHKLTKQMSKGDIAAAMQVVTQARLASDLGFAPPKIAYADDSPSVGLLTFYVLSRRVSPFPVHRKITSVYCAARAENKDFSEDHPGEALAKALDDVRGALIQAAQSIASILNIKSTDLSAQPSGWFASLDGVCRLDRIATALLWMNDLVGKIGMYRGVSADDDVSVSLDPHGFRVEFHSLSRPVQTHTMLWPALPEEEPEDCMNALTEFLRMVKTAY